jgi:hypothetical protein
MVSDTRLSAEVSDETSENTSDSDATESATQVQPTGQVARSQPWSAQSAFLVVSEVEFNSPTPMPWCSDLLQPLVAVSHLADRSWW